MSFKEVSFEEGTEELDKSLAHTKMKRRAETNSFSKISFEQRMLAQEAETNSFSPSLSKRTLSFRMCLRIFLLGSFQLVCAALLLENGSFRISFSDESLQTDQLVAAYSISFKRSSLQPEELAAAYFNKSFEQHSFQQESFQQDELGPACLLSPTRAMQLESLQQKKLSSKSFHQLDLQISLSLSLFSFHSCSSNSFEQRALHCAALLFRNRFSRNQLQNNSVQSFQLTGQQLTGQQLCLGFVSGGASETRASTLPLQLTASTLISLSLAFGAWLKSSSKIAWKRRTLTQSLCTASLSPTSSTPAYSTIASRRTRSLRTTSFRRLASTKASSPTPFRTTSSFRRTLLAVLWFSFLVSIFFSNSFGRKEIEKKDELSTTVLELELEELMANKTCSLGLYDHLEQKLWSVQLQELSLQQNNQEQQNQLSATVPDRELLQLHLSQLCQQDPDSATSRQLPEEPLSASGLQTAAWPAAVQIDKLSFSKQKLARTTFSSSASNSPASQRRP